MKEVARFSHIASVRRRMKVELRLDFDVATLSIFEQSQLDQSGHGISGPTLGTGTAAVSQYEQTRFAMRQRQVLGYPPREQTKAEQLGRLPAVRVIADSLCLLTRLHFSHVQSTFRACQPPARKSTL